MLMPLPILAPSMISTACLIISSAFVSLPGDTAHTPSSMRKAGSKIARQFIARIAFHALAQSLGFAVSGGMLWTPPISIRCTSMAFSHSSAVVRRPDRADLWYIVRDMASSWSGGIASLSRLAAAFTRSAMSTAALSMSSFGIGVEAASRARSRYVPRMNPAVGNRLVPPGVFWCIA